MIEVTKLDIEELNEFVKYSESDLKHLGLFIAESKNVILRALKRGYEPYKLLIEDKMIETEEGVEVLSYMLDVPTYFGNKKVLSSLVGYNLTCGIICVFKRKELVKVDKLIKDKKRIVVLENVCNSQNIGSIFRNAAAFGYDAVLLTNDSADPLNRKSLRVAMGNVFNVPYGFINDVEEVKEYGYKTVSMALRKNTININDPILKKEDKLAILLGSEGPGLKDGTIDNSDYVVKIPMSNEVDSLNVASASAVALWELTLNRE